LPRAEHPRGYVRLFNFLYAGITALTVYADGFAGSRRVKPAAEEIEHLLADLHLDGREEQEKRLIVFLDPEHEDYNVRGAGEVVMRDRSYQKNGRLMVSVLGLYLFVTSTRILIHFTEIWLGFPRRWHRGSDGRLKR
jgi:hypothetical protein